jgi:hypothetical protein
MSQRICTTAEHLATKLTAQFQPGTNSVAQPDARTDISNCATLAVYVTGKQIAQTICCVL